MLPRGDDKDEDDFHLFTRRFTACRYRYPTIICDIEVLLIRGLLNHFMNMKVGTPRRLFRIPLLLPLHPLTVIVANLFPLRSS